MNTPMHILIIPSWYPLFKGDVGGSFFREQAIALKKAGYAVGVIYPQIRSLKNIKSILQKPYGLMIENDEGVNTCRWYTANYFPKNKNYNKGHWVKVALKLFNAYLERFGKPDIIHVHSMLYAGFAAQVIQKKYGIPYVITEHSSAFARNLIGNDVLDSLKPVVENAQECIAVSRKFSEYLETKFSHRVWHYIPNIVNDDFFTPVYVRSNENTSKIRIISICNLNKNKNTALLIRAFSQLLEQLSDLELVIGGDGPERAALENLVKKLKIDHAVRFLGNLTRNQVKDEIQKSSLFVVSSHYETFGVVAIEALALGKPVVSTRCGGPESIINTDVGVLVENNSVPDLVGGIFYVCTRLEQYDADLVKKYCLENFSEKAVLSRLTKIYHEHCNTNE